MYRPFLMLAFCGIAESAIPAPTLMVSSADAGVVSAVSHAGTTTATVAWSNVVMPAGRILLIREPRGICALRFTAVERRNDGRPETSFESGEETQIARYEWRFFPITGASAKARSVKSGRGSVIHKAAYGIGRWILFGGGNDIVRCGPIRTLWSPPTSVFFSDERTSESPALELAATSWTSLSEVDPSGPSLIWFRLDSDRKPLQVSLDAP